MDTSPLASMGYFLGINNVDSDVRLMPKPVTTPHGVKHVYPLSQAWNVDIDNTYGLSTRAGYNPVPLISGNDIHSLWSIDSNWPNFYVDGTVLYEFMDDYSKRVLRTGLTPNAFMSYAPWGNLRKIYMTNDSFIGYYKNGTVYDIVDPQMQYKAPLPAGHEIVYFYGRLYVACDEVLYISDAMCDHYDIRYGYRNFSNHIDLLAAIDDGIYVADGSITWFLEGLDPQESMNRFKVLDVGAVPYSDIIVNGQDFKDDDGVDFAVWASPTGMMKGGPKGDVKNLTIETFSPPSAARGFSIVRNDNIGTVHYVLSLQ